MNKDPLASMRAPVTFVPVDLDRDYPMFEKWWAGHKSLAVPKLILPRGWIAVGSGVPIAVSFLYVVEGKIAVIEWTTSNPQCAFSHELIYAVHGLYEYLEQKAAEEKCVAILSFVAPNSHADRIMQRMGYVCTPDSQPHKMVSKPVVPKETPCP